MYEVVEAGNAWIVRRAGVELARYRAQSDALQAVADRMKAERTPDATGRFSMRFGARRA